MTPQEYRALAKPKRKSKYGAVQTVVDGISFPSKREACRYRYLRLLERGGKIIHLELQPTYPIEINGYHICQVKLDFRYFDNETGQLVVEDAKGMDNPLSRLKRKLVEATHDIAVRLV